MALAASPPPPHIVTTDHDTQSLQLDDDIAKVRAEIDTLTQRRNRLTSTLLSSTQIQSRLRQDPTTSKDASLTEILDHRSQHNTQSTHRLAFGVTAFPFIDPSPDTSNEPLTGIRFDICKRNGTFDSPYYVLCKRIGDESSEVRVHRHTIPALVPLRQYEERYLPLSDEGYGSEDSVLGKGAPRQDLQGFVGALRADLMAWRLRQEGIDMVRETLGLGEKNKGIEKQLREDGSQEDQDQQSYGVSTVEAVGVDAHFVRIVWTDGRVGRIKIGHDGSIQRAVVIGQLDNAESRIASDERRLVDHGSRIDTLVDRLKEMHERQALSV